MRFATQCTDFLAEYYPGSPPPPQVRLIIAPVDREAVEKDPSLLFAHDVIRRALAHTALVESTATGPDRGRMIRAAILLRMDRKTFYRRCKELWAK